MPVIQSSVPERDYRKLYPHAEAAGVSINRLGKALLLLLADGKIAVAPQQIADILALHDKAGR